MLHMKIKFHMTAVTFNPLSSSVVNRQFVTDVNINYIVLQHVCECLRMCTRAKNTFNNFTRHKVSLMIEHEYSTFIFAGCTL